MPRVFFLLFALIVVFHVLRWFFTVALPEIFRVIGMLWDWLVEVASGLCSDLTSSWNALRDRIGTRPDAVTKECHHDDQSLLDSPSDCDIKKQTYISQPSEPMWPFESKNEQAKMPANNPPSIQTLQASTAQAPGASNVHLELAKTKTDLSRAKDQLKSHLDTIVKLSNENDTLKLELAQFQKMSSMHEDQIRILEHKLNDYDQRYHTVLAEIEALKPFAAVKTDQRRMTYSVSPELHRKWQSIMRDTTRLQVVELLGQPSEILTVTEAGAVSPIQMVRKSAPAPRKELCDHVMSLVGMDLRLRELLRGSGCTAWVYSDDTLAPGVIFFSTESLGGQISRIFPPEC